MIHDRRIVGFDGIRGIAILMVFIDHRVAGANAMFLGGYGVHIFFVLSGFLIVNQLHRDRLAIADGRQTTWAAWKSFLARRAARVFPLYYGLAAVILVAGTIGLTDALAGKRLAIYGLFLTNIYLEETGQWMGAASHAWSLAVEEQFYFLIAPMILLIPAARCRSVCVIIAGIALTWSLSLAARGQDILTYMDSVSNFGLIAIGGALSLRRGRSSAELSAWLQPLFLFCLIALPLLGSGLMNNPVIRQLAQPLIVACLLAEMRDHQHTSLVRLLKARPLVRLGTISYGFYLMHPFIGPEQLRLATFGVVDVTGWRNAPQALLLFWISAGVAAASWLLLERPIIREVKRSLSGSECKSSNHDTDSSRWSVDTGREQESLSPGELGRRNGAWPSTATNIS